MPEVFICGLAGMSGVVFVGDCHHDFGVGLWVFGGNSAHFGGWICFVWFPGDAVVTHEGQVVSFFFWVIVSDEVYVVAESGPVVVGVEDVNDGL